MQKVLLNNLFCKLKAVRDVSFSNLNYIDNILSLSSSIKMELVFNLRKKLFYKNSFYVKKQISGSSSSYNSIYDYCFRNLWDIFLNPISESFFDRFSYGFRPYRDCYDFIFCFKNMLKISPKNFSWYLNLNISPFFVNYSLLNSFLVPKDILKFCVKNEVSNGVFSNNKIIFSVINCLFNGLVWFIFIKIKIY